MVGVTACIATVAALAALLTRPSRALAIYCGTLVLLPQALTVPLGAADFSVSRICILAVLANAIVRAGRQRSVQWLWIDGFIVATWAFGFVALMYTVPAIAIERHAGNFFDTILPYIAARLIVTSQEELLDVVKSLAIFAVPVVILGVWQMFTGSNPIGFLSEYYAFGLQGNRFEEKYLRLNLHRAAVTFTHPISLGLYCAMVATTTLMLWKQRLWPRPVVIALIAIACLGLFSTLSNGPLLAVAGAALVFLARSDWRLPAALSGLAVVCVISIAAYSGESYDEVLTDFAYNPQSAQFRLGLFREALGGGMNGHWWMGYGYVGIGPGTVNTDFHWSFRDLVNIYLALLVRTGLLGLIPFVLANAAMYVRLAQAIRQATDPEANWTAWCLLAAMFGWNVAFMTSHPLTGILQLLYLFLAISANMPDIVSVKAARGS